MPRVIGLRSPHARVGRIIHFGRMLDKIRLDARGALPPDYRASLGDAKLTQFDGRCCRFLGVTYPQVRARTLQGGCDEEILLWAHAHGAARSDEECLNWNRFMAKIGWRDDRSSVIPLRVLEYGLGAVRPETLCELLDADEGRPLGGTRSWEDPPLGVIVAMGVSGCGKSTIGKGLAQAIGWEFLEADDFHSKANVAKMSAGIPLDDADRAPWLASVRAAIEACAARGSRTVVACSALKEAYRLVLAPDPAGTRFAYLRGDFELLRSRLHARKGHFMGEELLRSQFAALEEPPGALSLDINEVPPVIISRIREVLGL